MTANQVNPQAKCRRLRCEISRKLVWIRELISEFNQNARELGDGEEWAMSLSAIDDKLDELGAEVESAADCAEMELEEKLEEEGHFS